MNRTLASLALLAMLAAGAPPASAQVIDFESDSRGDKPNGFVSTGSPDVQFSVTSGGWLDVAATSESNGNGLRVFGGISSVLTLDFARPMQGMSLTFGNDDPCCTGIATEAFLRLFYRGMFINDVYVQINRNDRPDQTIGFSGATFDRAQFGYNANAAEVVDDIFLVPADFTVTPEPASMALVATGLAGLVGAARRKRNARRLPHTD